jgi:hypothetical protein
VHALITEDQALIAMEIEHVLRDCGFSSIDFAISMKGTPCPLRAASTPT